VAHFNVLFLGLQCVQQPEGKDIILEEVLKFCFLEPCGPSEFDMKIIVDIILTKYGEHCSSTPKVGKQSLTLLPLFRRPCWGQHFSVLGLKFIHQSLTDAEYIYYTY